MAEEKTVGQALAERVLITQELMTENERLREENKQLREAIRRIAEQDAMLSVCNGNVTVTIDAFLTDDEREAITEAADSYNDGCNERCREITKLLRALLERTK